MGSPFESPTIATCPACEATVYLDAAPPGEEPPPASCVACGREVPDPRRAAFVAEREIVAATPETPEPEEERFSRSNLFRSLGNAIAERGLLKIDEVKSRFDDLT